MASSSISLNDVFEQCRDMDASLTERLAMFAAAVRDKQPSFTAAVDRLVERLHNSGAGEAAPNRATQCPRLYCRTSPAGC